MALDLTRSEAQVRLEEASRAIVSGVATLLPGWVLAEVRRILDAWGRVDDVTRAAAEESAESAGAAAAERIGAELEALFALEPASMRATPLEVVRTAVREPTAVLAAAGVPPVERDEFCSRSWPDDAYDLTPRTLADLGDPELGPVHLVWGLAKAALIREHPAGPAEITTTYGEEPATDSGTLG